MTQNNRGRRRTSLEKIAPNEQTKRTGLAADQASRLTSMRDVQEHLRLLASATNRLWADLRISKSIQSPQDDRHSKHVARISLTIAQAMGISTESCLRIYRAGYLHDVGGVAVSAIILGKPSGLTPEERRAMQVHPVISRELLSAFLPTQDLVEFALAHHERLDGNGYPQGLVGTSIPVEARVLAVADAMDAMMCNQPYRYALSFASARAEIAREAGRQFDSCIVEALMSDDEHLFRTIYPQTSSATAPQ